MVVNIYIINPDPFLSSLNYEEKKTAIYFIGKDDIYNTLNL